MVEQHRVVATVSDGMPIFEVAVPCEIFGIDRAELAAPWYDFAVVPVGQPAPRLGPGFELAEVSPALRTRLLNQADTLIVPACANVHASQPAELLDAVRAAHARGARILSICSGAFVLAAAGVLDGRRATTHWMHAGELASRYPQVSVDASVLYIEDRNVITSAGTAAGLDACLHLVRSDHGATVAAELARRLVTPPHREGGQAQYYDRVPQRPDDPWLADLLAWLDRRLDRPVTTAEMAARVNVSTRTLERRFAADLGLSPLQWTLRQRIRRAQQYLESTDRSIDWIAHNCGFGSSAGFRVHFGRHVGLSPSAYRRTFWQPPLSRQTAS